MIIQRNDLINQLKNFYKIFHGKIKEINLFGIQDETNQDKDIWNDWLGLNIDKNIWIWKGTTNPGKNSLNHEGGAAHVCYGFHEDIWIKDIHAPNNPTFSHEALCQRGWLGTKPISIWRDIDKNFIKNEHDPIQSGIDFCINFHRASLQKDVTIIGDFGAGCQVTQHAQDFIDIINLIKQTDVFKNNPKYLFSYLLTNKNDWFDLNL